MVCNHPHSQPHIPHDEYMIHPCLATSTTDWSLLTQPEMALAVNCGSCDGQFDTAYVFDNDDTASVELICDCCRGLGHLKRVCPSNRNRFRSLSYAIAVLQSKLSKVGGNVMRRPPGRGQRPPSARPFGPSRATSTAANVAPEKAVRHPPTLLSRLHLLPRALQGARPRRENRKTTSSALNQ
jgi:hypothetical protein